MWCRRSKRHERRVSRPRILCCHLPLARISHRVLEIVVEKTNPMRLAAEKGATVSRQSVLIAACWLACKAAGPGCPEVY